MARDHLLPAALIGQFSLDSTPSARKRKIWCTTKQDRKRRPRCVKAENVGYREDFYSHPGWDDPATGSVDDAWRSYEQKIPVAINSMKRAGQWGLYDTELWLRVLVPMVAGLYVRGLDFDHGAHVVTHDDNMQFSALDHQTNKNLSRVSELIRLLAPICAADWRVFEFAPGSLINSDRGYTLSRESRDGQWGITVPLSSRAAVMLVRRDESTVATAVSGEWRTPMRRYACNADIADQINRSISRNALSSIYSPNEALVRRYGAEIGNGLVDISSPLYLMWGTRLEMAANDMEWRRLTDAISHPPDVQVRDGAVPLRQSSNPSVQLGWSPPWVMIPLTLSPITAVRKLGMTMKFNFKNCSDAARMGPAAFNLQPAQFGTSVRDPRTSGHGNV